MNEKVKQIFEVLGVESEEEFKLGKPSSTFHYKFDDELYLYYNDQINEEWRASLTSIADIIKYGITKIPQKPKLTNKDKIAIKFLKNCGWHYIARDKDKSLCAYKDKPSKQDDEWDVVEFGCMLLMVGARENILDLKISWEDTEPLCLDDFTEDDLKEN